MTRATIYVRVSTKRQGEKGVSLDEQIAACVDYAAQHDYTVIGEPFRDSYTGESIDRPALDALRELVLAEKPQIVIAYSIDRLSRDMTNQLVIEREFKRYGVKIEYATEEYDDSPHGIFTKNVRSAVAQLEKDLIKIRTNRDKRAKARRGAVISSQPCYGYTLQRENGPGSPLRMVVDEAEARIVRMIFDWYTIERMTIRAIAFRLDEMGIKPRGNWGGKKKLFDGWGIATIRQILSNEAHAGTWYYNKTTKELRVGDDGKEVLRQVMRPKEEWIAVPVPAIVTPETFAAAQVLLMMNKELASRNRKHDYLFSGRLTCACERRSIGNAQPDKGGGKLYYRCPQRIQKAVECDMVHVNIYEAELEPVVWQWLVDTVSNIDDVIRRLNAQQEAKEREHEPMRQRLADLDALCAENRAAYQRWGDRFERGKMTEEEYDERTERLDAEYAGLQGRLAKTQQQLSHTTQTPQQIADIVAYCRKIATGMSHFRRKEKQETLGLLNVQGRLAVEDGWKVVYVTCVIVPQEHRLPIAQIVSALSSRRTSRIERRPRASSRRSR